MLLYISNHFRKNEDFIYDVIIALLYFRCVYIMPTPLDTELMEKAEEKLKPYLENNALQYIRFWFAYYVSLKRFKPNETRTY